MREHTTPKTTARTTPARDPRPAVAPERVTPAKRGFGAKSQPFSEAQAIQALQRVARRWPSTLILVHHADGGRKLNVKHADGDPDELAARATIADIDIPTEACT